MRCRVRGQTWLLLLLFLTLQGDVGMASEGGPKVSLDTVWAASDTITVTLITTNLTDHKVVVSVRRENDSSVTVLDHLPLPPQQDHTTHTHHHQHKIEELSADTRYQVCVSASPGEAGAVVEGGCYLVRTLPKADNITGLYAAGVAVGIFLVAVVVVWVLYRTLWNKWLAKLLPNKDKYEVEQPAKEQTPTPTTITTQPETVNT